METFAKATAIILCVAFITAAVDTYQQKKETEQEIVGVLQTNDQLMAECDAKIESLSKKNGAIAFWTQKKLDASDELIDEYNALSFIPKDKEARLLASYYVWIQETNKADSFIKAINLEMENHPTDETPFVPYESL